ncbi:hypothetical protein M434DRAFT_401834 [Hypoxylon sp. CO27-5]|nr:hypothetical protein M434DRAFT_401834 [Hypoxylon sp. CO27-5]
MSGWLVAGGCLGSNLASDAANGVVSLAMKGPPFTFSFIYVYFNGSCYVVSFPVSQ